MRREALANPTTAQMNTTVPKVLPSIMYRKFKRRFFEPLVLLEALSKTQGERITEEPTSSVEDSLGRAILSRRELLRQLCRACDFDKGGGTVTSIVLGKTPQGPVFWISLREPTREKVDTFIRRILDTLHSSTDSLSSLQARLLVQITSFVAPRLRAHTQLLRNDLKRAQDMVQSGSLAPAEKRGKYNCELIVVSKAKWRSSSGLDHGYTSFD